MKTQGEKVVELVKCIPGIEENEIDTIIKIQKTYDNKLRNRIKIVWSLMLLFTFVLFYFFIPVNWTRMYPNFLPIFGAISVGILLYFFVENMKSRDGADNALSSNSIPIAIFGGAILAIIFFMRFEIQYENELLKNGQLTKGVIVSGKRTTSRSIRRSTSTSKVNVKFTTIEGQEYNVTENVLSSEFYNFNIGQEVDLIYSKKCPSVIDLLTNSDAITKYTGSEDRSIVFSDLLTCLEAGVTNLKTELDKIQFGWSYNAKDSIWINERRNTIIKFTNNHEIQFASVGLFSLINPRNSKELGFETEISNVKFGLYVSEKYNVITQLVDNESKHLSIVNIEKKVSDKKNFDN